MTRYVLEILDGDAAGTVVELGSGRVLIGRKPDCDLVLRDEKCSGHHAEIVFEDGQHLLRDLGSTNGTTLDGRRVEEVVLSPRDTLVLGRIRAMFRAADDAAAASERELDDLHVGMVDAGRLARSGRRRGSLLFTLVFVAVLGAGAFVAWRSGMFGGENGGGPRQARPLAIAGNRLGEAAANLESEGGWDLQAVEAALPFDLSSGRARANSGVAALVASGVDAEGGGEPPVLAVARLAAPVPVTSGQALQLLAHVRTAGRGRALVRAVFGAGDEPALLVSGSEPIEAGEGFREVSVALRAPRGVDRVRVELIAFVPGAADEVLIDDVGLVFAGEVPAIEGTAGGTTLNGVGAALRIDGAVLPTLLEVVPLVGDDPLLGALARHGLLVASDAGLGLEASLLDGGGGYRLSFVGAPVRGLALSLPPESADCRTRGPTPDFERRDPEFEAEGVTALLCGSADNRAQLEFGEARPVRAQARAGTWRIELPGATSFDLRVVFTEETVRARELVRSARFARDEGRLAEALATLDDLVRTIPHDLRSLRDALQLRAEILARQEREVETLLRDGHEAEFFDARVGYQRVAGEVDALLERYGAERVARAEELVALRGRMAAGLAALDAREGLERKELLVVLAAAFEQVGNNELAKFVRDYVARRLPQEDR